MPPIASQSMPPTVSVVIPTVRRPNLVTQAVKSVLAQTMRDLELIVVVDGPDPATIASLALIPDDRLRVIQNQVSVGPGSARNVGAAAARGPWLAFLDDDDEWLPEKLERQLAAVGSPDQRVIVTCRSHIVTPRARFIWPRRIYDNVTPLDEYLFDRRTFFMGDSYLQTSSVLMPRTLFDLFTFPPLSSHEDWELWLRVTKVGRARTITVDEPLVIVHTEEERASLGSGLAWRNSLGWLDSNRELIGRRAYAGFCLTNLAPQVARNGEFAVFFMLLWRAFRRGRPRLIHLLIYFVFGLVPMGWRRRIRGILYHRAPASRS
jgi:glycosyltransferase involved in cell wall biosynthesis